MGSLTFAPTARCATRASYRSVRWPPVPKSFDESGAPGLVVSKPPEPSARAPRQEGDPSDERQYISGVCA
jgi:hypothetical protein